LRFAALSPPARDATRPTTARTCKPRGAGADQSRNPLRLGPDKQGLKMEKGSWLLEGGEAMVEACCGWASAGGYN
jgi:hypothetical protein